MSDRLENAKTECVGALTDVLVAVRDLLREITEGLRKERQG